MLQEAKTKQPLHTTIQTPTYWSDDNSKKRCRQNQTLTLLRETTDALMCARKSMVDFYKKNSAELFQDNEAIEINNKMLLIKLVDDDGDNDGDDDDDDGCK